VVVVTSMNDYKCTFNEYDVEFLYGVGGLGVLKDTNVKHACPTYLFCMLLFSTRLLQSMHSFEFTVHYIPIKKSMEAVKN
jgi:hypothetical protein